jgi:sugar phosphate isomerase/epimerase
MSYKFKIAMCNEAFDGWDFAKACNVVRKAGFDGIELAHFTLAEDPVSITPARRRELSGIMKSEGLEFVGLHWLMVAPKGLHVTTADEALRTRSWQHVRHLVDLCADLGPGGVMIFGSPKQRTSTGGMTPAESTRRFVDGLVSVAPHAHHRGVTILIEPLSPADTDTVTTLEEAAALVREINHPAIRTMFDVHNAVKEKEPHHVLVERHFDLIYHVHVQELDGRHPGAGDYDFKPVLEVLKRRDFQRWVSFEVFDFKPGAEKIANDSLRHFQSVIAQLPGKQ